MTLPNDLKRLVLSIAQPLVPNVPIYLESVANTPLHRHEASAFTGPDTDLDLWQWILRDAGQWRGRGIAVCLLESYQADHMGDEFVCLTTCLHEMAHIIERGRRMLSRPDVDELPQDSLEDLRHCTPETRRVSATLAHIGEQLRAGVAEDSLSLELPRIDGHGCNFFRMCHHVGHRVRWYDNPIRVDHIANHEFYGLRDPDAYRTALGDELEQLRNLDLWTVADMPIPRAFEALYMEDTEQ